MENMQQLHNDMSQHGHQKTIFVIAVLAFVGVMEPSGSFNLYTLCMHYQSTDSRLTALAKKREKGEMQK